jgi:uncharacterized protein
MRVAACLIVVLLSFGASAENTKGNAASEPAPPSRIIVPPPAPAQPITPAQVHEILSLTGGSDMRRQMLEGMLPEMQQMIPYMPDSVIDDFRHSLEMADFDAAVIQSFQARLSTRDAVQIIAFYKSPAGQRMIGAMPAIENEWQQAGAALGQQVMMEVIQRHHAEIEAARKKYEQEHAVSTPRS